MWLRDWLSMEDMEAAIAYYEEFPHDVEKRLWENEHDYPYIPDLLDLIGQMESAQGQLAALSRGRGTRRHRIAPYSHQRSRQIR